MNPIHPTLTYQNSNFYFISNKSTYILIDILAKLKLIITQSAPEQVIRVWVIASEGVRRVRAVQSINNSHAAARGLRAEGGIIHYQFRFARGHFEKMATKQRARRRRAAFTLIDNDGQLDLDADNSTLETDPINWDSDG